MKRVILTGAGGAIGVHMVAHILETTDWQIIGIDSFTHKGHFDRLSELLTPSERLTIVRHDLTASLTERQVAKLGAIDYIINLASLSDVQASIDDPVPFIRNNTEIVLTMLELARLVRPKAFIQFSTDEVYGPAAVDQGHAEWDTILPSNPYAASKAAQEAIAIAYWRSYGVPVVITNTMNNFAETQGSSKFPVLIQKKLTAAEPVIIHTTADGTIGTRYYIHSRAAADAVLFILQNITPHLHQPGEVDRPDRYNIVGDVQLNNLELAQRIADLMGKPLTHQLVNFHDTNPGHDVHYGLDGRRLAAMGWKNPQDFNEALTQTINWQLEHPEWIA